MQQQTLAAQWKQTVAAKEDDAQRWQQRSSPQTGQRSQSTSCENPLSAEQCERSAGFMSDCGLPGRMLAVQERRQCSGSSSLQALLAGMRVCRSRGRGILLWRRIAGLARWNL